MNRAPLTSSMTTDVLGAIGMYVVRKLARLRFPLTHAMTPSAPSAKGMHALTAET
jgi:hypothetical protein